MRRALFPCFVCLVGLVATLAGCALGPEPTAPREFGPSHAKEPRRDPAGVALLAAAERDLACPTGAVVVRHVALVGADSAGAWERFAAAKTLPVAEGCGRRALYAVECEPWPASSCSALLLSLVAVPPPAERIVEP